MKPSLRSTIFVICVSLSGISKAQIEDEPPPPPPKNPAPVVNIPATRVSMMKPVNFDLAKNFIGLVYTDVCLIQVYDLIGGNYYTNAATFSKEKFESKGISVAEYKELTFSSYPAKFALLSNAGKRSMMLVFGDTTFSVMITGLYPENNIALETTVREIIFSTVYDKKIRIDHLAAAKFILKDHDSKFKFAKASSGTFFYSLKGNVKNEYIDEPFVTVCSLPRQNETPSQIAELMTKNLVKYGGSDLTFSNESTKPVNGYDTYEFEMSANLQKKLNYFYFLVVIISDKAVVIQARFPENSKVILEEIKKLAYTIKIKD